MTVASRSFVFCLLTYFTLAIAIVNVLSCYLIKYKITPCTFGLFTLFSFQRAKSLTELLFFCRSRQLLYLITDINECQ